MRKRADASNNWQARAQEFRIGQAVQLVIGGDEGRVVSVFPAIGMIDIQFPNGNLRFPVEDVNIRNPEFDPFIAPKNETVPGGAGSGALTPTGNDGEAISIPESRVASRYLKKAIYWANVGRKYRCTRSEHDSGQFRCPRCEEEFLRRTIYKREDGKSVRLLGCPSCLFLIREGDILSDHCQSPVPDEECDL